MHFFNTTVCISSLLMATASASTLTSFEVPGTASGTAIAPDVDTTTVWETSTHYLTSAVTITSIPASVSASSAPITSVSRDSSADMTSSCSSQLPANIPPSLYVTGNQTFIPVTLWEGSTTRVIYPQNSTALEIPTGHPTNDTPTVVVTTSVSVSKTAGTTSKDKTSSTVSASASVSEVPVNGASEAVGNTVLGLGAVVGFMALL